MSATYDVSQLADVQRAWVASNVASGIRAMRDAARRSVAYYVQRIDQERALDTGHMRNAFAVDDVPEGATATNAAGYFDVMDRGRRPGAKAPPLQSILDWVLRKRLVTGAGGKGRTRAAVLKSPSLESEARRLAFVIRASIARKGIRPRNLASGEAQRSAVLGFVAEAIGRAMRARPHLPPAHGDTGGH